MASTDLLSVSEAKRVLRIDVADSDEDDLLPVYITAASEMLDEHIGPTVVRSVTTEVHDGLNRAQTGYRNALILRHRPVMSIGALTVDGVALTQTDDYHADPYPIDDSLFSGVLRRRWGNVTGAWDYGTGNILCTYSTGRVLATSNVSARFKRACGLVLENLWRDREVGVEDLGEFAVPRQSFPTFAMPRAAAQLLTREMGFAETFGIGG
jgi:hypothetical protein